MHREEERPDRCASVHVECASVHVESRVERGVACREESRVERGVACREGLTSTHLCIGNEITPWSSFT
jgi:hypothetical protein